MKRDLRWTLRDPNLDKNVHVCHDHSCPGEPLLVGFYSQVQQQNAFVWGIAEDLAHKLNITKYQGFAQSESQAKNRLEDAYYDGLKWLSEQLKSKKCKALRSTFPPT